jgi:hypothetical protein
LCHLICIQKPFGGVDVLRIEGAGRAFIGLGGLYQAFDALSPAGCLSSPKPVGVEVSRCRFAERPKKAFGGALEVRLEEVGSNGRADHATKFCNRETSTLLADYQRRKRLHKVGPDEKRVGAIFAFFTPRLKLGKLFLVILIWKNKTPAELDCGGGRTEVAVLLREMKDNGQRRSAEKGRPKK